LIHLCGRIAEAIRIIGAVGLSEAALDGKLSLDYWLGLKPQTPLHAKIIRSTSVTQQ